MNDVGLRPATALLNNRVRRYKLRQMMMPDAQGGGRMLEVRRNVLQRVEGIDELIPEDKPFEMRSYISKKHLRPGGMAPSEWMRSVRADRDTPVADYSAPGVNTTRRVAYRPPITVSPFLLALSVSYFKQTVWRCG